MMIVGPVASTTIHRLRSFALLGGANIYRVPPEMRGRPAREIKKSIAREHGIGGSGHGRGPLGHGG